MFEIQLWKQELQAVKSEDQLSSPEQSSSPAVYSSHCLFPFFKEEQQKLPSGQVLGCH